MNRYVCIHAHFYQPPRENPWLEEIEVQDSAYPYHDWNARICAECYAPNAAARLLDADRKIIDIVNNYSKISFNFGPTLLSWMEVHEPAVYKAVLAADEESKARFDGHGSAIAQVYNHMIMPLAHPRDKRTQVIWGIRDFVYRFRRKPEGMWLAETAVDYETLEILVEHGVLFTILAPGQAMKIRKRGEDTWHDVAGGTIDPRRPYLLTLPSGKSITIFFYDGSVSHDVAFGGLLDNGEQFAQRLLGVFDANSDEPQLCNIATDGETYGHHHKYGDMALAYCLHHVQSNNLAQICVYGQYLEKNPPLHEVQLYEGSSWSCAHGVERWKADCGCNSGMHPGWSQSWRAPLRGALDWLRENFTPIYEEHASALVSDPWKTRDEYIEVILERSPLAARAFLDRHAKEALTDEQRIELIKLLELERYSMLMYTSCGWFFDEISGIETVQIIQYAARAIQLAKEISAVSLEETFKKLIKRAPSNIEEYKDGSGVYELFVAPAVIDLLRVGVHYAVSSLFEEYPETARLYSYTIARQAYDRIEFGKQTLVVGKAKLHFEITGEETVICFAVLHLGDHNLVAGAFPHENSEDGAMMHKEIKEAFTSSDMSETIRLIDTFFKGHSYSFWHLFKDEQRKILDSIFSESLADVTGIFQKIYDERLHVMEAANKLHQPLPKSLKYVAEFIINQNIRGLLTEHEIDTGRLEEMTAQVRRWSLPVDTTTLGFIIEKKITLGMADFLENPAKNELLERVMKMFEASRLLSLELNTWKAQNMYFSIGKMLFKEMDKSAQGGNEESKRWVEQFQALGERLKVRIA